jgi:hypothetical protein
MDTTPVNSPITMSLLVLFQAVLIVLLQQTANINRITFTYCIVQCIKSYVNVSLQLINDVRHAKIIIFRGVMLIIG